MRRVAIWLVAAACVLQPQRTSADEENWANSAEAYFLTSEERREWDGLSSRESRQGFIERYWLKRDPTPGTEKNEFREAVLARIKTANARFPIQKTPGSRTKRGMVFVVFGTPARVQDTAPTGPQAPRAPAAGTIGAPVGFTEGTESTSVWTYDRERTPRLLEALGNRPSLDVTFVIDPSRHRDEIQAPGLVEEYREMLARKSIVNADLITPGSSARSESTRVDLPRAQPPTAALAMLENARGAPRGADGSVFGNAVLWGTGKPKTLVWFYLPTGGGEMELHGRFRSSAGEEIVTVSERADASPSFSISTPRGIVVQRSFPLPPGTYAASFAVEAKGVQTAASANVLVPDLSKGFAVSSLLLSAGPSRAESGGSDPFVLGAFRVPPRADAVFLRSESLWYFLEVAGVTDPKSVTLETRLRRGTGEVAASGPFPAGLVEVAPGRYVSGFELPLSTLAPGDYVLYVNVRSGAGPPILRRGDFRIEG